MDLETIAIVTGTTAALSSIARLVASVLKAIMLRNLSSLKMRIRLGDKTNLILTLPGSSAEKLSEKEIQDIVTKLQSVEQDRAPASKE